MNSLLIHSKFLSQISGKNPKKKTNLFLLINVSNSSETHLRKILRISIILFLRKPLLIINLGLCCKKAVRVFYAYKIAELNSDQT